MAARRRTGRITTSEPARGAEPVARGIIRVDVATLVNSEAQKLASLAQDNEWLLNAWVQMLLEKQGFRNADTPVHRLTGLQTRGRLRRTITDAVMGLRRLRPAWRGQRTGTAATTLSEQRPDAGRTRVPRLAHSQGSATLPAVWRLLHIDAARPLRFALVGAVCAGIQLVTLALLLACRLDSLAANVLAYLFSAQVNFLLSNRFIWYDRWSRRSTARDLVRRWVRFHLSIAGTFLLSQGVFVAARLALPPLWASALGIGLAAVANFLIQDRLTFDRLSRS